MENYTRLFDIIQYQNKHFPQKVAFANKVDGEWKKYSTQQVIDKANQLSKGLIEYGIEPGDKIAIISTNNRAEWNITDIASLQVGAIDVPIYPTISPAEYEFIFNDAGIKIVFVSDVDLLEKLNQVKDKVPTLKEIF